MTSWRPTPALVRASLLALGGLAGAVVLGLEALAVLAAPFVVLAVLGLWDPLESTCRHASLSIL